MTIKKKLQENSDKIEKRLEEFEKIGNERLAKIPEKIEEFMTKKGISRRQGIVIIFIIAAGPPPTAIVATLTTVIATPTTPEKLIFGIPETISPAIDGTFKIKYAKIAIKNKIANTEPNVLGLAFNALELATADKVPFSSAITTYSKK